MASSWCCCPGWCDRGGAILPSACASRAGWTLPFGVRRGASEDQRWCCRSGRRAHGRISMRSITVRTRPYIAPRRVGGTGWNAGRARRDACCVCPCLGVCHRGGSGAGDTGGDRGHRLHVSGARTRQWAATEHVRAALTQAGFSDVRIDLYLGARPAMAESQPNVHDLSDRPHAGTGRIVSSGRVVMRTSIISTNSPREDVVVDSLDAARRYRRRDALRRASAIPAAERLRASVVESSGNDTNFQKLLAGRVDLVPCPVVMRRAYAEVRYRCATLTPVLALDALTVDSHMARALRRPTGGGRTSSSRAPALKAEGIWSTSAFRRLSPGAM